MFFPVSSLFSKGRSPDGAEPLPSREDAGTFLFSGFFCQFLYPVGTLEMNEMNTRFVVLMLLGVILIAVGMILRRSSKLRENGGANLCLLFGVMLTVSAVVLYAVIIMSSQCLPLSLLPYHNNGWSGFVQNR